jgi:outer membrane autotransporter protein
LVNGDGSGANGGGGDDDTTSGGFGGDQITDGSGTGNGTQDDGQGGNGSNSGDNNGGLDGEGFTNFTTLTPGNDPYVPGKVDPLSDLAHDIIDNTANQVLGQLAALDSLGNHFASFRGGDSWNLKEAKRDINFWVQSYGGKYNVGGSYSGNAFGSYVYGVDVGADRAWQLDKNNVIIGGVFAGYGRTDQDFRHTGSEAEGNSYGGGLYGIWLEQTGWFADLTVRGSYLDGEFDSYTEQYQKTHGEYDNYAISTALNFGRRFEFKDGWFAEPSIGLAYVHLGDYGYTTGGVSNVDVTVSAADVFRFKGGALLGRNIILGNHSRLQPYIKVFGIEQVSSGGKVQAGGNNWRPTLDGAAAQIGCGILWQLNDRNQLHLDYDAEFGAKYDKPFGLSAGYRYQF